MWIQLRWLLLCPNNFFFLKMVLSFSLSLESIIWLMILIHSDIYDIVCTWQYPIRFWNIVWMWSTFVSARPQWQLSLQWLKCFIVSFFLFFIQLLVLFSIPFHLTMVYEYSIDFTFASSFLIPQYFFIRLCSSGWTAPSIWNERNHLLCRQPSL